MLEVICLIILINTIHPFSQPSGLVLSLSLSLSPIDAKISAEVGYES